MRRVVLPALVSLVLAAGCSVAEGVIGAGPLPSTTASTTAPPGSAPPEPPPGSSGVPPASTPAAGALTWARCGALECATLQVPLDHDQPGGRQIGIALNRRPATDRARRIGSLLVNPGGPGASGVDFLPALLGRISSTVKARFDVIGFDPRGTGRSSPVRCLPTAELDRYFSVDPVPDDAAEKAFLLSAVQRFVAGCQQRSGDLLPHVGTEDAVRDMDRIRAAVGDEKLSFLGFSYGTSLGATYAELFPGRVRALVLDGAVDPSLDTPALNRVQGEGFDKAFDAFAADCARQGPGCPWRPAGGPAKAAFLALSSRIEKAPVPAGRRRVGPSELTLGVARFLYSKDAWPQLAQGLASLEAGSGAVVLAGFDDLVGRKADGSFSNDQEANVAINCLDNPAPRDVAAYEQAAAAATRVAPAFGPTVAWSGLVCGLWPVPTVGKAEPLRAPGTPPILVIGTTNDPATPFVWAEALASQLPQGRLLRFEGEGHTAYGDSGCATRIADDYLLTLRLPPGQLRC